MKKIKGGCGIFILILFATTSIASKDFYILKRQKLQNDFVGACSEEYIGTEVEIHFEAYCRCVFDEVSPQFTNSEFTDIDNNEEPISSEFDYKLEQGFDKCIKKYIQPVRGKIEKLKN